MIYVVNRKLLIWIQLRDGIKLVVKLWILELVDIDKFVNDEKYFVILGEDLYYGQIFGIFKFIDRFSEIGKIFSYSDFRIEIIILFMIKMVKVDILYVFMIKMVEIFYFFGFY